jgi:flagellar motor switch protein FliN/FliY
MNISLEDMNIMAEIYNAAMGMAASTASNLLRKKVNIINPKLEEVKLNNFVFCENDPAWGVEVNFTSELAGTMFLVFKELDIIRIVDIWLGGAGRVDDETLIFSDMHMSAIGELVFQMMGQSAKALQGFLNTHTDIAKQAIDSRNIFKIGNNISLKGLAADDQIIAGRFNLTVDDIINSEMAAIISVPFSKRFIAEGRKAFGMKSE